MSNLRRARATASMNAWAQSGGQSSVARAVYVPVGRLIAGFIEREVRLKVGAAEPDLRVPHDHGVDFLLRSLLLLGHPRVAARSICADRAARVAHPCATPRARASSQSSGPLRCAVSVCAGARE